MKKAIETPKNNVLKEKNATLSSRLINSSASKSKVPQLSHIASHNNLNNFSNTPVNRRIQFLTGSNKIDSSKKKQPSQTSKASNLVGTPSNNQSIQTNETKQVSSILKATSSSNNGFGINPVCNGIDYTEIMLKKNQFGYSGPGYIVEFDCDSKYLRGLRVEKGLWSISAAKTPNRDRPNFVDLGPMIIYKRLDDPDKNTPCKQLTNFDFSYKPKHLNFYDTSSNSMSNLMNSYSADDLNLEFKCKPKKSLKWAENLERIDEKSQGSTPNESYTPSQQTPGSLPRRKLRKSLSMGDINANLIEDEIENLTEPKIVVESYFAEEQITINSGDTVLPINLFGDSNKENLNSTYDKDNINKLSPKLVIQNIYQISPNQAVNPVCPIYQKVTVSELNVSEQIFNLQNGLDSVLMFLKTKFLNENHLSEKNLSSLSLNESFAKLVENREILRKFLISLDEVEQVVRKIKEDMLKNTLLK